MKVILLIIIIGGVVVFLFYAPKIFKDYDFKKGLNATSTATIEKKISSVKPTTTIKSAGSATSYVKSAQKQEIPDSRIPHGFTREQLSPYFEKIRIASASAGSGLTRPMEIRLYAHLDVGDKAVNITGWRLKSNRSEFIIPQAVELYQPSGSQTEGDIILNTNNYVNIYGNVSANGKNFRLNKCSGYLENNFDFTPSLPQSCPTVYRNRYEITYLSGQCQTYLFSLGSCKPIDYVFYNSLAGTSEGNICRAYLNTIGTYGACFEKYRSDKDFLSNEWRVWVNTNILDSQHDRVNLFDKEGLLVSDYIY